MEKWTYSSKFGFDLLGLLLEIFSFAVWESLWWWVKKLVKNPNLECRSNLISLKKLEKIICKASTLKSSKHLHRPLRRDTETMRLFKQRRIELFHMSLHLCKFLQGYVRAIRPLKGLRIPFDFGYWDRDRWLRGTFKVGVVFGFGRPGWSSQHLVSIKNLSVVCFVW
jgi:hypothetical protein